MHNRPLRANRYNKLMYAAGDGERYAETRSPLRLSISVRD